RPRPKSTSVAGSGVLSGPPPGVVPKGTFVLVMLLSIEPSSVRGLVAVKKLFGWAEKSPNVDEAEKLPRPNCPWGMVGPLYVTVGWVVAGCSCGLGRPGVGPWLLVLIAQSAGVLGSGVFMPIADPPLSPPKS